MSLLLLFFKVVILFMVSLVDFFNFFINWGMFIKWSYYKSLLSQREAFQKMPGDLKSVKRGRRGKSVRSLSDLRSFEHLGGVQPSLFFQSENGCLTAQ